MENQASTEMMEQVLKKREQELARLLEYQKMGLMEKEQDQNPKPLSRSDKSRPAAVGCYSKPHS